VPYRSVTTACPSVKKANDHGSPKPLTHVSTRNECSDDATALPSIGVGAGERRRWCSSRRSRISTTSRELPWEERTPAKHGGSRQVLHSGYSARDLGRHLRRSKYRRERRMPCPLPFSLHGIPNNFLRRSWRLHLNVQIVPEGRTTATDPRAIPRRNSCTKG